MTTLEELRERLERELDDAVHVLENVTMFDSLKGHEVTTSIAQKDPVAMAEANSRAIFALLSALEKESAE